MSLEYPILSETKIDESFSTAQFNVEGYEIRTRPDRDKYGGGLIEFVQRGLICKGLREYKQLKHSECLYSELSFTNKNWIALVYTDRLSQAIFQCFSKNLQYL